MKFNPFKKKTPPNQEAEYQGNLRDISGDIDKPSMESQLNSDEKRVMDGSGKGNIKELNKTQRLSTLNYFTERLLNRITKGTLDIQGSAFEISYSKIMSETHSKRVIFIKEFPTNIYAGHLERLRLEAKKQISKEYVDKVDVNIIEHTMPNHISFVNNRKLKSSERNFRRQLIDLTSERISKVSKMLTGATVLGTNRDDISIMLKREERLKRKIYSYGSINKHQSSGGETLKSYIFVEVSGETTQMTDDLADIVIRLLSVNNYVYEEVTDLTDYLNMFGLASLKFQRKMKWDINPLTLTSDVNSVAPTYSEGIIRSEQGDIYIGNSMETGYPVFTSFSESADAANVLVVAGTGSGKTVLVKTITLGCLNHRNNTYNMVITDYKGGEWSSLVDTIDNTVEISMGIANPKFIDTIAIPDFKTYGFPDPQAAYYLAHGYTVKLLTTLVGTTDPMKLNQVQNICNDIVTRVYLYQGVDVKRPSTYYKSLNLNFSAVLWEAISYVTTRSGDMVTRHGNEMLKLVKTSLEYYFTSDGSKKFMFENSVDIEELMNSKLIIFDYGAQTAGGQGTLEKKEILAKILQKNFFTTLYSFKNKLREEYTIEVEEEVQRQLGDPLLVKELNDKVTGGRSSNRSTILITNTIGGLLNNKQSSDVNAIRENINTVMLGKVKKEVADQTMEYFDIMQAQSRVRNILTSNEGYKHAFLLAFNTGKVFDMCLAKVSLPKKIIDSKIFESRNVEEYEAKEI